MVNPVSAATDAVQLAGRGATITTRLADDIIAAHRVGAGVDVSGLAKDLIGRAANDPGEARALAQQLETHLTPVERGQLASALDKEAPAAAGMTEAQKGLALDLTQMGIDVVGMFDPTPTTGAINTGISLARHDWWGAALSAISMVPYAGDLARAGKLGKYAKVVVEVAEMAAKDSKFAKEVRPALEAIEAGLKKIPGSVLDMLPKGARDSIEAMKSTIGKALGRTADAVAPAALRTGGKLDMKVAAERYAEAINSNKPWSWADKFAGEKLTAGERAAIRQEAIDRKLIPDVSLKPGTKYADFGGAGLVQKTDTLPKDLWRASDAKQFDYLDKRIPGGRPPGTTWHHTEIPGQMELVPFGPHNVINHNGGRSSGHWADAPR